jgi:hypothetical protein
MLDGEPLSQPCRQSAMYLPSQEFSKLKKPCTRRGPSEWIVAP